VWEIRVDKEAKDYNGLTALHHAASNGHDATVWLLVREIRVDKEAKGNNGLMALHHAAFNGHDTTVRLLVR
jgi:ankyrin repeat protein